MELNKLYQIWFSLNRYVPLELKRDLQNVNFDENKLENLWRTVWFAKKDQQKIMDNALLQFASVINQFIDFKPQTIPQKFAMIILYDQIPRNIFRGEELAYKYDEKAFLVLIEIICELCYFNPIPSNYADSINLIQQNLNNISSTLVKALPIHLVITCILSLIHQENIIPQKLAQAINASLRVFYPNQFLNIQERINQIQTNHYDRVYNFGRIPERNRILKRNSTEKEMAFLTSVEVRYAY